MSIECFILSQERVVKVSEVKRGESLVLGEVYPALQSRQLIRALGNDLLEHSFFKSPGRQMTIGLKREKINSANITGFTEDGELVVVRWMPNIYGEDSQPPITCRGFDFAKPLLVQALIDTERLLMPPV